MNPRTVRQLRAAAGISQSELAKRAGLHEDTIARIERGLEAMPETMGAIRLALMAALDEARTRLVEAEHALGRSA